MTIATIVNTAERVRCGEREPDGNSRSRMSRFQHPFPKRSCRASRRIRTMGSGNSSRTGRPSPTRHPRMGNMGVPGRSRSCAERAGMTCIDCGGCASRSGTGLRPRLLSDGGARSGLEILKPRKGTDRSVTIALVAWSTSQRQTMPPGLVYGFFGGFGLG